MSSVNLKEYWGMATAPLSAACAIVPAYRDLVAKSAQQLGQSIPQTKFRDGLKLSRTVGGIVGTQLILEGQVEKRLPEKGTLLAKLQSSATVGVLSSAPLAVFNGQTMNLSWRQALGRLTPLQVAAITVQETFFVAGVTASEQVARPAKKVVGEHKIVDYAAAFVAGAGGSLAGHPANTALTRWQNGLKIESPSQLLWGAARKARAVGTFSVLYKFVKEVLN
jgi:hypothetical protein